MGGVAEHQERKPMIQYVVQLGDSLFRIANRFNVTLKKLEDANPEIPAHFGGSFDLIFPGQIVKVPAP